MNKQKEKWKEGLFILSKENDLYNRGFPVGKIESFIAAQIKLAKEERTKEILDCLPEKPGMGIEYDGWNDFCFRFLANLKEKGMIE